MLVQTQKNVGRWARITVMAAVVAGLQACGGGSGDGAPSPAPGPVQPPAPAPAPVAVPATISKQPQSVTVKESSEVRFQVEATGDAPLRYQWRRGGVDIVGATTALYTIPKVALSDDRSVFSVVVANTSGSATSTDATLSVLSLQSGTLSLVSGSRDGPYSVVSPFDGTATSAKLDNIRAMAAGVDGILYITNGPTVRKIDAAGNVVTLAGVPDAQGSTDGKGSVARFFNPRGLAVTREGNLLVADLSVSAIRRITPQGDVATLFGKNGTPGYVDGPAEVARFTAPQLVTVGPSGDTYVLDILGEFYYNVRQGTNAVFSSRFAIRKIDPAGEVSTVPGGLITVPDAVHVGGLAADVEGNIYMSITAKEAGTIPVCLRGSCGVPVDKAYVQKISPTGVVTVLAGSTDAASVGPADGKGPLAQFGLLGNIARDSDGSLYVVDMYNQTIRKISTDGTVTTPVGQPPNNFKSPKQYPNSALTWPYTGDTPLLGILPGFIGLPNVVALDTKGGLFTVSRYNVYDSVTGRTFVVKAQLR